MECFEMVLHVMAIIVVIIHAIGILIIWLCCIAGAKEIEELSRKVDEETKGEKNGL